MRLQELFESQQLDEIERLTTNDYTGGKSALYVGAFSKQIKKLPGGSGILYSAEPGRWGTDIKLWDPAGKDWLAAGSVEKPTRKSGEPKWRFQYRLQDWATAQKNKSAPGQLIGKLSISPLKYFPLKNAMQVETITVDEDYRGMGLAKALYGIVLTLMKIPLLAGSSQTPGGRRNWLSLSQIPGVEMKGYVSLDDSQLKNTQIDIIMGKLGGQYIGKSGSEHYFAFDVVPGTNELAPAVKTSLSKVYGNYDTGLYAVWTGK